ncbi:hypothetical protein [Catellatospora sp. TT07R-123]|uniref:hypothetical protein n=1 Tax=Catellatospora sp. TT07R-123 TaxID=2733863 RepID=UPI001BB2EFB3|nr:hypothetical protein [Catellatospora sp. TT07R-123]
MLLAVGVTYFAGGFGGHRFDAEPPACTAVEPSLHLLGVDYIAQQTANNSCDLRLSPDDPRYVDAPKITVAFAVDDSGEGMGTVRQMGDQVRPLSGVGDEAYLRDRDVFLQVDNLFVGIMVFPNEVSSPDQVLAFATDLADQLRRA